MVKTVIFGEKKTVCFGVWLFVFLCHFWVVQKVGVLEKSAKIFPVEDGFPIEHGDFVHCHFLDKSPFFAGNFGWEIFFPDINPLPWEVTSPILPPREELFTYHLFSGWWQLKHFYHFYPDPWKLLIQFDYTRVI